MLKRDMLKDHACCFADEELDKAMEILGTRGWTKGFCALGDAKMHYVCAHDGNEVIIYPHKADETGRIRLNLDDDFVCASIKTGRIRLNPLTTRERRDAFERSLNMDAINEIARMVSGYIRPEVPWWKKTGNADKEHESE